uniref:photosystem I assembly protein Ycf3 n=1 Tax=Sinobambusa rubroligula TaxID=548154 RepID=UPI00286D41D9|nr:photosystem I assembly protein Ycf3 [Sinobambusa rubroligula]WKU83537.1 photosystem I assembly protein Ycf3 [Sinobambusa rubroligula]
MVRFDSFFLFFFSPTYTSVLREREGVRIERTKLVKETHAWGRLAQSEGNYAEALQNYYEATRLEIDPYDRSYILYNIGLIHTSNGEHTKALEYYFRALERNPFLPQAFNNMAVICHYVRLSPGSSKQRFCPISCRKEGHFTRIKIGRKYGLYYYSMDKVPKLIEKAP